MEQWKKQNNTASVWIDSVVSELHQYLRNILLNMNKSLSDLTMEDGRNIASTFFKENSRKKCFVISELLKFTLGSS